MQKVQYAKSAAPNRVESLQRRYPSGPTAMQWAQINVTGGVIATTPVQQQIYAPDATLWRWMATSPSTARATWRSATAPPVAPANFPSIAHSGRLASDPPNTLPQTEVQLSRLGFANQQLR
jgi:hypothetical protein